MSEQIILPGLIDMHVHLRDPGYTEAEDFNSGTVAALAGGVVSVFDMPNNAGAPTINLEALDLKMQLAERKARTEVGLYFGYPPQPEMEIGSSEYEQLVELFTEAGKFTHGLKLYCDITTENEHKHGADAYRAVVSAWLEANPEKLIITHVEGGEATAEMIDLVAVEFGGRIHIPHISKEDELTEVIKYKKMPELEGQVTCGVTPHHLSLTEEDVPRLGWYARMKPSLGKLSDRLFLRKNIAWIDVIETDHAPHTVADKENSQINNPQGIVGTEKPTRFGVPGLEAMLPILLMGENEGWITRDQIIDKTHTRPAQILNLDPLSSEVIIDPVEYDFTEDDIYSKCGWSPYACMPVFGKIGRVVVGGNTLFLDGEVIAEPGEGHLLLPRLAA